MAMGTFGYLAFRNLKRLHGYIHSYNNSNAATTPIRRQDRIMLAMLLVEVSIYIITSIFLPVITVYVIVTSSATKDSRHNEIESFLRFISLFFTHLSASAPFFIYMTVSNAFRRDFYALVQRCCHTLTKFKGMRKSG
jgi:ABC-type transport system involved in cytochrome bd biosynthesis fused ATPase/permease subunit